MYECCLEVLVFGLPARRRLSLIIARLGSHWANATRQRGQADDVTYLHAEWRRSCAWGTVSLKLGWASRHWRGERCAKLRFTLGVLRELELTKPVP